MSAVGQPVIEHVAWADLT